MAVAAAHAPSLSPRGLLVLGAGAAMIAAVIFLSLSWKVATYAPLVLLDVEIANWLHKHGTAELTAFMIAISDFHDVLGSVLLALAFGAVLAWLRQWYWLATLALAMGGGIAINSLLKEAFARVRPYFDDPVVWLTSHSFPSGHTAGAVLFYGVLAAFLVSRFHAPNQRFACLAGAVFAIVLVAFSRMYLGAHYLSDVVAAACSSAVWLVFCLTAVHEVVRRRMHGR